MKLFIGSLQCFFFTYNTESQKSKLKTKNTSCMLLKDRRKEVKNNHKLYIVFVRWLLLVIFAALPANQNSPNGGRVSFNGVFFHQSKLKASTSFLFMLGNLL
jgi:hypothetical protein